MEEKITELRELLKFLFYNEKTKLMTKEDIQKLGDHLLKTWDIKKYGHYLKSIEKGRWIFLDNLESLRYDFKNNVAYIEKKPFRLYVEYTHGPYDKTGDGYIKINGYLKDQDIFECRFKIYDKYNELYLTASELPSKSEAFDGPPFGSGLFLLIPNKKCLSWRDLGFIKK